jgi:hypothetical protein
MQSFVKKDFPKSSGKAKGPRFPRGLLLEECLSEPSVDRRGQEVDHE